MLTGIPAPLNYYLYNAKDEHAKNVDECLQIFTTHANIDRAQNAKTVQEYDTQVAKLNALEKRAKKLKRTRGWLIFLTVAIFLSALILTFASELSPVFKAVIACAALAISIVAIVLICKKIKTKLNALTPFIDAAKTAADERLLEAYEQVKPLNDAIPDEISLRLFEKTLPCVKFDEYFTDNRLSQLINYDYPNYHGSDECVKETLSGELYERPFLYDRRIVHEMGSKTYQGTLLISWQERRRDKDGNMVTVTRRETLVATVVKPYPEYFISTKLYYGHEAIPDLCFSRTYSHVEDKSERALERKINSGERKLRRMQEKSLKAGGDFTQVENTEFEILFNATNRNNELDFREMFTVKAQENMLRLLLYKEGYGDDFNFEKQGKLNVIESEHSHLRPLYPTALSYRSHDVTKIERSFKEENDNFFKAVYFDFAPIFAIPAYQSPNPDRTTITLGNRTQFNYEEIANKLSKELAPQDACTTIIFKAEQAERQEKGETFSVLAKGYTGIPRTDIVRVRGGDGHYHNVPVNWTEYIPVERRSTVRIEENAQETIPTNAVRIKNGYAYVL